MEQQPMRTPQKDILNTQNNAGEYQSKPDSSENTIDRVKLPGTPFTMINMKEKGTFFLTMGKYKLSPDFETADQAEQWLQDEQWNLTLQLLAIVIENQIHKL